MSEITDITITMLVLLGVFLMAYMAYRQQGLLDTFNEVKAMFEDKIEDVKDMSGVYK